MNRHIGFALGSLLTLTGSAFAQSPQWKAVFHDSVGDASSTSINPGDSFTFRFDLEMTGGASASSLDYYLAVFGNNDAGAGKFNLTSANITGSAFSIRATSNQVTGALNPTTAQNIGAVTDPFRNVSGTQFVADLTFSTPADLAAGAYQIMIDNNRNVMFWSVTEVVDEDFNTETHPIFASYSVNVVPEPASLLGLTAVMGLAMRRVRR